MKLELYRQNYDQHYTITAIEPFKAQGSKLIQGAWVVCRKLRDFEGYTMDYGIQTATNKRLFDKPRKSGTMICEREFEFACQEIRKELGIEKLSATMETI